MHMCIPSIIECMRGVYVLIKHSSYLCTSASTINLQSSDEKRKLERAEFDKGFPFLESGANNWGGGGGGGVNLRKIDGQDHMHSRNSILLHILCS